MLNDKSEIKKVEHIYSKYNLVSYEYDDEYDDTYDSHDIGESAQDDTLEMDRPFTTPRVNFPIYYNKNSNYHKLLQGKLNYWQTNF